jgi:DNA transposition AAA+ family ATPase
LKVNTAENRLTLMQETDTNATCRDRIRDYLARTGIAIADFARRINYSAVTVNHFLANRYHNVGGTSRNFVKAASDFMDAHAVGQSDVVDGEIYETANVYTIRETFRNLLPRPVAYMIYAPPGSQKTFVLEHEVARLNREKLADETGRRAFYVYARQNIRPRDLVRRVCITCGCRTGNDIEPMLQGIRFDFRNRRVLLVVDEAQHLSIECFETLRELLDQAPRFSLLFAGSHDLKKKFDEFSATLEQWNSRIIAKVRLPGLDRSEAIAIIHREIGELLRELEPQRAQAKIDKLITAATTKDHFERNRSYINVRTLTNALDQIKAEANTQVQTATSAEATA